MTDVNQLIASMPDKARYRVDEVVGPLSALLDISVNAARMRIYRAICEQRLEAKQHLGSLRIPRHEVLRILHGEDPQ
jgi:hypothetical protein